MYHYELIADAEWIALKKEPRQTAGFCIGEAVDQVD
jgi:hypothetical protein